MDYDKI